MGDFNTYDNIICLIMVLNRRLLQYGYSRRSIPYKGLRFTTFNLQLIHRYLPKCFHINQLHATPWIYHTGMRFHCNHIREDSIDFTNHYNMSDLTSLPFIFNTIKQQSGIYKLTCVFDKRISLTMGLTDRNNISNELLDNTLKTHFYIDELIWNRSHISLSSQGELHINDKDSSDPIHLKNVHFTDTYVRSSPRNLNMTIIYDSYRSIIYFYENNILIREQIFRFNVHDIISPFVHIYYNKASVHSNQMSISRRQPKQIMFIV